jgi:hypothetical protein
MRILLIDVPYDCGQVNARMGAGPTYLLERGLAVSLCSAGHEIRSESVRVPIEFHTEWRRGVIRLRGVRTSDVGALTCGIATMLPAPDAVTGRGIGGSLSSDK